jgi:hypothetical protein
MPCRSIGNIPKQEPRDKSDLITELNYWRCERPDEWKIDEWIRAVRKLESKLQGFENEARQLKIDRFNSK